MLLEAVPFVVVVGIGDFPNRESRLCFWSTVWVVLSIVDVLDTGLVAGGSLSSSESRCECCSVVAAGACE